MKFVRVLLAMAALAMFAGISQAVAQDGTDQPPCIIINGVKCYVQYDDCGRVVAINCPEGSTGTAQFTLIRPGDPCATDENTDLDPNAGRPLNAILLPRSVDVTVNDNTFGQIRTVLDESRSANYTTIVTTPEAAEAGQVYPLAVRIKFYAFAELASDPDRRYVSQAELVFGSDNVQSVSPFSNETFTLLNDVNYYVQGDERQTTVFTLKKGTTNLTIDGEGEGRRNDQLH
jgi:hypothetical protein